MVGLLLKVSILSLALSCVIKYGGPLLGLPATSSVALAGVVTPVLVMAVLLGGRWYQSNKMVR